MPCINVGKPKSPTYFPVEVIKPTTNYWKYSILWKSIEMKCSFFSFFFCSYAQWSRCSDTLRHCPISKELNWCWSREQSHMKGKKLCNMLVNLENDLINSIHFKMHTCYM
jgi:hypothetical protein